MIGCYMSVEGIPVACITRLEILTSDSCCDIVSKTNMQLGEAEKNLHIRWAVCRSY